MWQLLGMRRGPPELLLERRDLLRHRLAGRHGRRDHRAPRRTRRPASGTGARTRLSGRATCGRHPRTGRARVTETDRVLVIGAGPIGLAAAAMLRHRGSPPRSAPVTPTSRPQRNGWVPLSMSATVRRRDRRRRHQRLDRRGRPSRPPDGPGRVGRHDMAAGRARYRRLHEGDRDPPGDDVPVPRPGRDFDEAAAALAAAPDIGPTIITHRFHSTAASRRSQRRPIVPRARSRWRSTSDRRPLGQAR